MKKYLVLQKILVLSLAIGLLATPGAFAGEQTITGIIEENTQGMIIIAGDDGEDYLVKGKDLSSMIGMAVTVTGTLSEENHAQTITVMTLEEIED